MRRLLTLGLFGRPNKGRTQYTAFRPTEPLIPQGAPACRVYGSVQVKKATGNLHVTTLGHGYMSWEHTDHSRGVLTQLPKP